MYLHYKGFTNPKKSTQLNIIYIYMPCFLFNQNITISTKNIII